MFAKNKVSQAVIDAVNSVLEIKVEEKNTPQPSDVTRAPMAPASTPTTLNEASEKVPTPTGMKVYGSSYGNSKKAREDQVKKGIDNLKGPKSKEMKEAAKPDFLDMDKDGNKKEPMKKAIADKSVKEELKGNQDKIDKNHNNKIDGQDFAILRVKKDIAASRIEQQAKKKVKEGREFTKKLLESVRKSDVPAYLRKAKGDTPLTMADVKGPKKDSISAPENLAKARNEEVERIDELKMKPVNKPITSYGGKPSPYAKPPVDKRPGKSSDDTDMVKKEEVERIDEKDPCWDNYTQVGMKKKSGREVPNCVPSKGVPAAKGYKEEIELDEKLDPSVKSTDTLAGRKAGGKKDDVGPGADGKSTKVKFVPEATIAGTSGWKPMSKNVKDKSGAIHSPMSRARDLARSAFDKVKKDQKAK